VRISVVIPTYNTANTLPTLLESLEAQTDTKFETIVVDDASSDTTKEVVSSFACRFLDLTQNRGPAFCRNLGARQATGEILVFTDSDCDVPADWIATIRHAFTQNRMEALMGKVIVAPSNTLGDAISALGYPAGGALGFDKMWKVTDDGYTDSLSSCNCAIKTEIFWEMGGFDEAFPHAGGEDSFLAYSLRKAGYQIKYCPQVIAHHRARDSLRDFIRWHFRRGISSYIFAGKVTGKKKFLTLRMWSSLQIIRHACKDIRFPLIILLFGASFGMQILGLFYGFMNRDLHERVDN
jgi:GT2 family glycosyltransferase